MSRARFLGIAFFIVFSTNSFPGIGWTKDFNLIAIGIRGGMNFQDAGLPPGEKVDFERFDVFGIVDLPWQRDLPPDWNARSKLHGSAGMLRGAGDLGFITTITPSVAITKKSWNITFDFAMGGALISDWKYGRQDVGGPFQFIGHLGATYRLPGNLAVGYRFHHMSDATIYGESRGTDLHMIEFSYYFGDD